MEVCTVGGYEEVGKNMTAVKVGEDVFIFDMGLNLPPVIELQEKESGHDYTEKKLRGVGAIADDYVLEKKGWRDKVRAIIISHAHLDHVGGVQYLAGRYPKAEIIATPFTVEVLKTLLRDDKMSIPNKIVTLKPDSKYTIQGASQKYKLEMVHTTHSTLQCVFPVLHTKEGLFVYGLDFKFDNYPGIGNGPNYKKLKELGRKGVKCLVVDALYSGTDRRTASERIARNLLEDALSYVHDKRAALFITTFSSHISRLKSIVDFGKRTGREIIFLGRSLNKYVNCANTIKMCPFYHKIRLVKYSRQVNSILKKVDQNRGRYLVVCTGHQAEPNSILDRISSGNTPFKFKTGDHLIFSSSVIPTPVNVMAREKLDKKLRSRGVRLQTDVHVSGHGGREDLRDLVEILKPKNIIPAHGTLQQETPMVDLTQEMGYKLGKTIHLSSNGKSIKL
jgi:ribonuclease J